MRDLQFVKSAKESAKAPGRAITCSLRVVRLVRTRAGRHHVRRLLVAPRGDAVLGALAADHALRRVP